MRTVNRLPDVYVFYTSRLTVIAACSSQVQFLAYGMLLDLLIQSWSIRLYYELMQNCNVQENLYWYKLYVYAIMANDAAAAAVAAAAAAAAECAHPQCSR
jgi:hypothetical protein